MHTLYCLQLPYEAPDDQRTCATVADLVDRTPLISVVTTAWQALRANGGFR